MKGGFFELSVLTFSSHQPGTLKKASKSILLSVPESRNRDYVDLISRLLSSNIPPSESERLQVESIISILDARIRTLSSSPHTKSKKVPHALQDVNSLSRLRDECKATLSPLRTIPFEILQHIMTYALPYKTQDSRYPSFPWGLAHVSSRWRTVAFSTPEFWTHFELHLTPSNRSVTYIRMLSLILDRSQNRLLDIELNGLGFKSNHHDILGVLAAESKRWRSLVLMGFTLPLLQTLEVVKGRVPALEDLVIDARNREGTVTPVDTFSIAPRLRKFVNVSGETPIEVPLDSIIYYSSTSCDKILDQTSTLSSSLETLVLREFHTDDTSADADITLPRVKALEVGFLRRDPPNVLFNHLTCPSLESLKVHDPTHRTVLRHVAHCLARSGSPSSLTTLHISAQTMSPGHLTSILRCTPGLVHLTVHFPPIVDLLNLAANIKDVHHAPIVPNLQALDILCNQVIEDRDTVEALNRLAEARSEGPLTFDDLHPVPVPDSPRTARTTATLEHLELHFPSYGYVYPQKCIFEAFRRVYARPGDAEQFFRTIEELASLEEVVHDTVPDIKQYYSNHLRGNKSKEAANRVLGVLRAVENLHIKHISDLYCSTMFHTIKRLLQLSTVDSKRYLKHPEMRLYHDQSARILERWIPRMLQAAPQYRWFVRGHCTVKYLSLTHDLRQQDAPEDLICGIDMGDQSLYNQII